MLPDFNKKTIDTLAKRAAYICTNPECKVATIAPNTDPHKSTTIGEAAHIYGARPGAKRYLSSMTDQARADITNGIWLCSNCHKIVDSDAERVTAEELFAWREGHEGYVLSQLGNSADQIKLELQSSMLSDFDNYPPIIRRIIIDKAPGWEYRLTAELIRFLCKSHFRKINDLRNGLYTRSKESIYDEDMFGWIDCQLDEAKDLFKSVEVLINELTRSWAPLGEPGEVDEIHHAVCLIRDHLNQIIIFEERIYFARTSRYFDKLIELFKDLISSQADQIETIPDVLDEILSTIEITNSKERPLRITKTIEFNAPKGWDKEFKRELKKAKNRLLGEEKSGSGIWSTLILVIMILFLFSIW